MNNAKIHTDGSHATVGTSSATINYATNNSSNSGVNPNRQPNFQKSGHHSREPPEAVRTVNVNKPPSTGTRSNNQQTASSKTNPQTLRQKLESRQILTTDHNNNRPSTSMSASDSDISTTNYPELNLSHPSKRIKSNSPTTTTTHAPSTSLSDFIDDSTADFLSSSNKPNIITISELSPSRDLPVKLVGTVTSLCSKLAHVPEWSVQAKISDSTG